MAARFKVLIAGGSLVGLTLALALERAGIDYEVFEKGEIGPDLGASIAIHGPAARILDQLGVWKDIEPTVTGVERGYLVDGKDGRPFLDTYYLRELMKVYVIE
jgi:2-polyprenyl-6-methoxyphenol hydroxylase-like FAD-dependent oxidoreductase